MIASIAWLLEFLLECSGTVLACRKLRKERTIFVLFTLLAWRAFADILTFVIALTWGGNAYGVALWICLAVQYAILYALGIQLAAKMVQEYRPLTRYVYKALALVASVATYIFVTTELWERKFLHAEAVSSLLLLAVVLIGWIGRKRRMEEPWRVITMGIVVACAGNALCAVCSTYFPIALRAYPIPAIAALILWNLSVLPRKPKESETLEEARLSLGKKAPASHKLYEWEQKRVI